MDTENKNLNKEENIFLDKLKKNGGSISIIYKSYGLPFEYFKMITIEEELEKKSIINIIDNSNFFHIKKTFTLK